MKRRLIISFNNGYSLLEVLISLLIISLSLMLYLDLDTKYLKKSYELESLEEKYIFINSCNTALSISSNYFEEYLLNNSFIYIDNYYYNEELNIKFIKNISSYDIYLGDSFYESWEFE